MKRKIAIRATVVLVVVLLLSGCDEQPIATEARVERITEAVTASTTENLVTVTFDSRGGSKISSQRVTRGSKVIEPMEPTKKCRCEFDGWYLGDEKWSFVGYVVTEDITLTAKWVDCFGLNAKEREILEDFVKSRDYVWRDVSDIRIVESPYDWCIRYEVTLSDGYVRTIDVQKEYVEEE